MAMGMAIFSIAAGVAQFAMAQDAADKQEALARENARLQEMETEETVRREAKEAARSEAQARARAAASGVTMGGSQSLYMEEQQRANQDRIRWIQRAGASRAGITRKEGKIAGQTTRAQGFGQLAGSVGSAYGYWKG